MTNNPKIEDASRHDTCAMIQALLDLDARGSLAPHGIGGLARDVLIKAQATIARLEARITQLESEAEFAAATYQAARDRIAELESVRGEPFMYGIAQPNGTPHYSELCVSGEASDLESEVEAMNEDGDGFRIVALFTAPPAPAVVVLPASESLRDLITTAARDADLIPGANYYTAAELAASALLDKIKELNP